MCSGSIITLLADPLPVGREGCSTRRSYLCPALPGGRLLKLHLTAIPGELGHATPAHGNGPVSRCPRRPGPPLSGDLSAPHAEGVDGRRKRCAADQVSRRRTPESRQASCYRPTAGVPCKTNFYA